MVLHGNWDQKQHSLKTVDTARKIKSSQVGNYTIAYQKHVQYFV